MRDIDEQKDAKHAAAWNYISRLYAEEDAVLVEIQRRIQEAGRGGINVSALEGRILQVLIQMNHVRTVVELGTLMGYSAIWMARALPLDGKVISVEKNPAYAEQAREMIAKSDVGYKIEVVTGDALEVLPELARSHDPFDMIFIDANKSAYVHALEWAQANLREGGLIVADNTLLFGHVCSDKKPADIGERQWQEMRKFNLILADREKFSSVMLPTPEGLSIALKKEPPVPRSIVGE